MRRESHVRICERLGVKLPGPTRQLNAVSGPTTPTWGWIQTPGRVRPMAYSTARAGTVVMENAAPMMKNLFRLDMRTLTVLLAGNTDSER